MSLPPAPFFATPAAWDAARRALFDAARAADVRDVVDALPGFEGWRNAGVWRRAKACPLCLKPDRFSATRGGWVCHGGCGRGDAVGFFRALDPRLSAVEAAERVTGLRLVDLVDGLAVSTPRFAPRPPRAPPLPSSDTAFRLARPATLSTAARLWRESAPADEQPAGGLVGAYLRARGVAPGVAARACAVLHLHAAAPYDWDRAARRHAGDTPAMVARLGWPDHWVDGVHVTHLAPDGRSKASRVQPAKRLYGAQTTRDGAPVGAWVLTAHPLDAAPDRAVLVVAEGIETTLALAGYVEASLRQSVSAFAALSLDRFQGGLARDRFGRTDWRRPAPDPTRPAAVLPWTGRVVLGPDADCAALVLQPGTAWERVVPPGQRCDVAALCAAHWWRQAGARAVHVATPPAGCDWADVAARDRLQLTEKTTTTHEDALV